MAQSDPLDDQSKPVESVACKVYEDVEVGSINGWKIYDTMPAGATITNVFDEIRCSRVIQLSGSEIDNGFWFKNADAHLGGTPASSS